jgi:hypothetical protein
VFASRYLPVILFPGPSTKCSSSILMQVSIEFVDAVEHRPSAWLSHGGHFGASPTARHAGGTGGRPTACDISGLVWTSE